MCEKMLVKEYFYFAYLYL